MAYPRAEEGRTLLGHLGLLRAVVGRARAEAPLLLTAWALLLAAVSLVPATLALADAVSLGALQRTLAAAPVADRIVTVELTAAPNDAAAIADRVRPELAPTLGAPGGTIVEIARSAGLVRAAAEPVAGSGGSGSAGSGSGGTESGSGSSAAVGAVGTQLASFSDLPAHATLTRGQWPQPGHRPAEAVVSEGAATALRLAVGDRVVLADSLDASRSVAVAIVGTYRPAAGDAYWSGSALELTGIERTGDITILGPIVIERSDLIASAPRDVELDWRLLPDVEAIRADDLGPARDAVASLDDRLGAVLPIAAHPDITTDLPTILEGAERSLLVTRTGVILLALQFGILAGYAIVLVAAVLAERRRDQVLTLRARGATGGHVVGMAIAEAAMLALPAALVAPFVAAGAVDLLSRAGLLMGSTAPASIDARMVLATALSATACVVALVVPTLASIAAPDGLRVTRSASSTLPQRLGLDVVLVVVAGLALWQLGVYGAPLTRDVRGSLGIDPLLIAAPAVGLLAGAVLAVRVVPRAAELAERVLARRDGAVPALGGRQLARRPLRYSRTALLLILAVAFGTYALADGATWLASQRAQAAYQTVGDVRVTVSTYDSLPPSVAGSFYRGISGVTRGIPVIRGSVSTGSLRDGQLLAVDPALASGTGGDGWTGAAAAPLAALTSGRLASPAIALPAGTRRLSVTIDAALVMEAPSGTSPEPVDPTTRAVSVGVVLVDGDGMLQRVAGGDVAIGGGRQQVEVPLAPLGPPAGALAGPLRLEAVELTLSPPTAPAVVSGTIEVGAIEASTGAESGSTAVDGSMAPPGWGWSISGPRGSATYRPPAGHPRRVVFPLARSFSGAPGDVSDGSPVTLRLLAEPTSTAALPSVASAAFLAATGTRIGDELTVDADAVPLRVRIVTTVDRLAPLDPASAYLALDAPSLGLRRLADVGDTLAASEWWLSVAPGTEASVLAAVRGAAAAGRNAVGRSELTAQLRDDPVTVGIMGALALGALAAAVFAIAGFLVGAATPTDRAREFAVLEALGLSSRQLRSTLVLEDAFLLIVGLGGGVLLGLVLAWAVLPFSIVGPNGASPVPPPTVVVPWAAVLPLAVAGVLLLIAAVVIAAREVGRRPVGDLLREWEG